MNIPKYGEGVWEYMTDDDKRDQMEEMYGVVLRKDAEIARLRAELDAANRELVSMGLATTKPGNGGGTRIADGMTLAELRDLLRNGSE